MAVVIVTIVVEEHLVYLIDDTVFRVLVIACERENMSGLVRERRSGDIPVVIKRASIADAGVWMWALLFGLVDSDALFDKGVETDVLTLVSGCDGLRWGVALEKTGTEDVYAWGRVATKCTVRTPAGDVGITLCVQEGRTSDLVRGGGVAVGHDLERAFLFGVRWAEDG